MPRGKPKTGQRNTQADRFILINKDKIEEWADRGESGARIFEKLKCSDHMSYPTFLRHLKKLQPSPQALRQQCQALKRENIKLRRKLSSIEAGKPVTNHVFARDEKPNDTLLDYIGGTPLVTLPRLTSRKNLQCSLYLKLEYFNPSGSIKDRIILGMVEQAEKAGIIAPNRTILVEPTSGNAGISLGVVAAAKGYQLIIVMPQNASVERQKILHLLGAHVQLTPQRLGMSGAIEKAHALLHEYPNAWMPNQFENPVNPQMHDVHTAQEIWDRLGEQVDVIVAGIGTGGTITGLARFFKERKKDVRIVGVEPSQSPVLSGGRPGEHSIEGIGAGFCPKTLDLPLVDKIMDISQEDACATAQLCARTDGIPVGISAGAALHAALILGREKRNRDKTIVVIAPDGADRYLSTSLFRDVA